ncbi:MAG: discoidin domain-containing protein [Myxococcota bacterium]
MHLVLLAAAALPAFAGYEASSFKKEDRLGKNYWNAASALDSKLETCWQVDAEQNNAGQWIQLDVPGGEVDKFGIVIGWAKDAETFTDYARVKSAKIEIFDSATGTPALVSTTTVTFEDKPGWQVIELPDTKVGGEVLGGKVKMTVTETYPGKDFPSLAVSEVRVHLKEFAASSTAFVAPFDSEAGAANAAPMALDHNPKTFWAGTGSTAAFTLKAPGYGLASLGVQSGPKAYARPKTIEVTANGTTTKEVLEDKPGQVQRILLPCLVGYTGGSWGDVAVKILDTYPGDVPTNGVAIAEVDLNAGSIEEF